MAISKELEKILNANSDLFKVENEEDYKGWYIYDTPELTIASRFIKGGIQTLSLGGCFKDIARQAIKLSIDNKYYSLKLNEGSI